MSTPPNGYSGDFVGSTSLEGEMRMAQMADTDASGTIRPQTVGYVFDMTTSTRHIIVQCVLPATVVVTLEGAGSPPAQVDLDEDGVVILRGLLGQALRRLENAEKETK